MAPTAPDPSGRAISALPSPLARAFAFVAIVVAGLCGSLIGWSFVDLQCQGAAGGFQQDDQRHPSDPVGDRQGDRDRGGDCTTPGGIGAIIGGLTAAGGVAVVAVLTLRAMAEWKRVNEDELFNDAGGTTQPPSTSRRNPSA